MPSRLPLRLHLLALVLPALAAVPLAAAAEGEATPTVVPTGAVLPTALAAGVFCQEGSGAGGLLLAFAGWTVQPEWAWNWATHLQARARLGRSPGADSGSLCVVSGPADASYRKKDIATADLAAWLLAPAQRDQDGPIVAIAHSSGAFVAHHFFHQLRALPRGRELLARIRYFNLDGAIGSEERELDADLVATLKEVHAVCAVDRKSGSESANAADMRALHARAPEKIRLIELDATDSGCAAGARWCLHDVLVIRRPFDQQRFDLARDYGESDTEHPVQDGYLPPKAGVSGNR